MIFQGGCLEESDGKKKDSDQSNKQDKEGGDQLNSQGKDEGDQSNK